MKLRGNKKGSIHGNSLSKKTLRAEIATRRSCDISPRGTRIDGRRIFTRRANRERERERMESTIVVEKARRDERKKAGRLIFRGRPTNLERERGREKEGEEEGAKKRERIHRGRMVDRWNALGRSTIANWKNTPIRLQFFSSARTHRAAEEFETGLAYDEKYIRRAR